MTTLQALITKLGSAEEGSRELDAEVAYVVSFGGGDGAWPMSDKPGYVYQVGVGSISGRSIKAAHYTTSLDASLPGENIVDMRYGGPAYGWAARQKDRKNWGYAKTEILARRRACLEAMADES